MSSVLDPNAYEISTGFRVSDNIPGLGNVTRQFSAMDAMVQGIGRNVTRFIGGALLSVGGGAGVLGLTRGIVGINTEVENARIGIGSLISAMTGTDMTSSLTTAVDLVGKLRIDAAKGAGELTDFAQTFQFILSPALQAGADLERVRNLNRLALTAGFATRGQQGLRTAGFDVMQALQGGVADKITPTASLALRSIDVSNEAFNSMTGPGRLETLERAFGNFTGAAEIMGRTWDAQAATLRENVKEISRTVSGSLFERWSDQLRGVNDWLERNAEVTGRIADNVSNRLVGAYDGLVQSAPRIGGALATVGGAGLGISGLKVARFAARASGPTAALALIGASIGAAAKRWPGEAASAASSLAGLGDRISDFVGGLGDALTKSDVFAGAGLGMITFVDTFADQMTRLVDGFDGATTRLSNLFSVDLEGTMIGWAFKEYGNLSRASPILGPDQVRTGTVQNRLLEVTELGARSMEILAGRREITSLFSKNRTGTGEPFDFLSRTRSDFQGMALRDGDFPKLEQTVTPAPVTNIDKVVVTIKADRLDNPDLVAQATLTAFEHLDEFRKTGRSSLKPRPF